jgi:hypothetical protein
LQVTNAEDGMAWLEMFLPAVEAHAIKNRLTSAATTLKAQGDDRTMTQLTVDAGSDLLLYGTIGGHAVSEITPTVAITVPALSLLGRSEEPAVLEGYGPIDLDTARQLASNAPTFIRILTHPETGAILSVGRDRYRVPADMRTFLRIRDATCRSIGCGTSAARSDIDHTQEWQNGGQTAHDNLAHLCPPDHELKHHTLWAMTQLGSGTIEWISPTGKRYLTQPALDMSSYIA